MPPRGEFQVWQWPINTFNPANVNSFMFMVEQEFPWKGKRDARAAAAATAVAATTASRQVRALQIREAVRVSYADLALARAAAGVFEAQAGVLRRMADVAEAKYAAGRGPQQDVLKAVLELSRLQEEALMADESERMAQARLNGLMNRRPDTPVGPVDALKELPAVAESAVLQDQALAAHAELRAMDADLSMSKADATMWKAEQKPDLMVRGGYMVMPGMTDALTASITISWPDAPWSKGRYAAQTAMADARARTVHSRRAAVELTLRQMVHEAAIRVSTARQRTALLRTTVLPQARQALEVSLASYQTDRLDFIALLDNQRALAQAELDLQRALAALTRAHAALESAVGTPLDDLALSARAAGAPSPAGFEQE
jgi:outer membrane protein TolC